MKQLTVLMTVKNGEKEIAECLSSILNQTFHDFEVLIYDDHSTDLTREIIKSFKDKRIVLICDSQGFIGNLNRGIARAKGKYIARINHYDVMDLTKLAIQFEVMETLNIDICATWVYLFGGRYQTPKIENAEHGLLPHPLKSLYRMNFIHHSTVMLRRSFLIDHQLRYEDYYLAEDYKLWSEMAKLNARFYMIPEPLLFFRYQSHQADLVSEGDYMLQSSIIQQQIGQMLSRQIT